MLEKQCINWVRFIEELIDTAHTDHRSAKIMAEGMLPFAEEAFGENCKEVTTLYHQLGIICLLMDDCEESEYYLLKAMEKAGICEMVGTNQIMDIAKHLSILYERKGRTRVLV